MMNNLNENFKDDDLKTENVKIPANTTGTADIKGPFSNCGFLLPDNTKDVWFLGYDVQANTWRYKFYNNTNAEVNVTTWKY